MSICQNQISSFFFHVNHSILNINCSFPLPTHFCLEQYFYFNLSLK